MTPTREEAIDMSREAGFFYDTGVIERHLERFIRLIDLARANENEACAKVCDEYSMRKWRTYKGIEGPAGDRGCDVVQGESSGAEDCAEAIRARMKPYQEVAG